MNDRYLYRAKRKDNGEWVEGDILQSDDRYYIVSEFGISCIEKNKNQTGDNMITLYAFEVDPSTLCQCIGIKDKNGKPIWENDIARRKIFDREVFGIVKWCDIGHTGFTLEVANKDGGKTLYAIGRGTYDDDMDERCGDEVIGNVFDNPELLEAK